MTLPPPPTPFPRWRITPSIDRGDPIWEISELKTFLWWSWWSHRWDIPATANGQALLDHLAHLPNQIQ